MHIQTHVLSGWCVADFLELTPRERAFAMVAASVADLDGLGLIASIDYYVKYHHVIGHNLLVAIFVATALTVFSKHRVKAFWLYLALFHLHLVLDYYGSGLGWGIYYFWPFSMDIIENRNAWNLASWQNTCAFAVLFFWMLVIALRRGRTPFEVVLPRWDQAIVERLNRVLPMPGPRE